MHTAVARRAQRRTSTTLARALALALVIGSTAVGLPTAAAAPGPAPESPTRTVIADVHTDAISTFWDDGHLTLGVKADTPELHTRYAADEVWFHVDDDSRIESWSPDAPAFVAPAGSTVWLAPMTQAPGQIWPGFSTESVPNGTLDGTTKLTLESVDGPGAVEVWTNGSFGAVDERLWSSDERTSASPSDDDLTAFSRGRVHLHANWAFTQPGVYHLTVRADATAGGSPVGDTAVYTFVVGNLPEATLTSTTLEASATVLTVGEPVTLTATVDPADAEGVDGAVEFLDGTTVLGHGSISESGVAELTVSDLGVGTRSISARFVPTVGNLATASTSSPITITVTDGSGVPFGIAGIEESYQPGDTLIADAVGVAPEAGQRLRWYWRVAEGSRFYEFDETTYTRELTASDDGYELAVSLWSCSEWDSYCNGPGSEEVARSAWVPVVVGDLGDPVVAQLSSPTNAHTGDTATIELSGRELGEDETLEVVYRDGMSWVEWYTDQLYALDGTTMSVFHQLPGPGEFAVRVLDADGLPIAQSDPMAFTADAYEVQIAGVQGVYRPGSTLHAQGIVFPANPSAALSVASPRARSRRGRDGPGGVVGGGPRSRPRGQRQPHLPDRRGRARVTVRRSGPVVRGRAGLRPGVRPGHRPRRADLPVRPARRPLPPGQPHQARARRRPAAGRG